MTCKRIMSAAVMAALATMPGLAQAAGPHQNTACVNPAGSDGCFPSIQLAIDGGIAGETIFVYPGTYNETALDRAVLGTGNYQFGLFVSQARSGITIQGVNAKGKAIKDSDKVEAFITTNATNDFGPSGIFIEGDHVTLAGLGVGTNSAGQNKTIEIIGDDASLQDCDITDTQGSVYLNDWRFVPALNVLNGITGTSHVRSYSITGNIFRDGVSIDIASGAGYTGKSSGRVISRNGFANQYYWPSISFNGSNTGVPWFVYSVGGAAIDHNEFVNTYGINDVTEGHIRARGDYDNDQFDWGSYFRENKYNFASVVGRHPPEELHEFSYPNGYGTFNHVRRISAVLEVAGAGEHVQSKH